MQPAPSSSAGKKQKPRRRKVADDIQEQHPESVKSLLAALQKAQKVNTETVVVESTQKTTKVEAKKHTVGARVARTRNESGSHDVPTSSRQRNSNSVSLTVTKSCNNVKIIKPLPQKIRIPSDVLDNLCFRFIDHIPNHEKFVNTRVCFQVELAHWFYVDNYVNKEISGRGDCPNMMMREFSWSIFSRSQEHKHMARRVDEVLDEWRHYKSNVPTYGAILLDESLTKVVLVNGFYASRNSWGFPKGKVNENEDPRDCAAREVYEETGYDFKDPTMRKDPTAKEHKIQKFINDTMVRLYVINDVPTDFKFAPRTKYEIRDIQWFIVNDLPTDKNDQRTGPLANNKFYTVMPFVQDLQNYIKKEQQRRAKAAIREQSLATQQMQKITPTDMLNSLSQVNMNQASMTPGKSENAPNVLSNLFNNFFAGNKSSSSGGNAPFSSPSSFNSLTTSLQGPSVPTSGLPQPSNVAKISSMNSAFSPFKPVQENIAQSLLNIVKQPKPEPTSSPMIAHPIAIPGRPKLPTINQQPQEQRPTPPKQKIVASETSAFKAIPKNKSSSSLKGDSESGSIFGSELALDRCDTRDRDSADYLQNFTVNLCDAWKNFKLDMSTLVDTPRAQNYPVHFFR